MATMLTLIDRRLDSIAKEQKREPTCREIAEVIERAFEGRFKVVSVMPRWLLDPTISR